MKNKLLFVALATGVSGAAYAGSSVTLYGIVDAGVGYQQTKVSQGDEWTKTRNIGLINGVRNGNRWGIKGNEDLGNGTSALFTLENGFDMGTGRSTLGGRLFGRQAYVGLTGASWGTVTLGRQNNLAADMVSPIDPFTSAFMQAGLLSGAFGSAAYARMDNAIKYVTPDFAGLKLGAGYAGQSSKTSSSDHAETQDTSNWIMFGARYDSGPLTVAGSYDRYRTNVSGPDLNLKGTAHMWNLFGAYDFDIVKLHLGYGQVRGAISNAVNVAQGVGSTGLNAALNDFTTVTSPNSTVHGLNYAQTNGYRQQAWMAGLTVPVGNKGQVLFSYQGSATKNTGQAFDGVKGRLNILSLGYVLNLSKRTSVYAIASYGSGKLKFDHADSAKLKSTLVGIGLQNRF